MHIVTDRFSKLDEGFQAAQDTSQQLLKIWSKKIADLATRLAPHRISLQRLQTRYRNIAIICFILILGFPVAIWALIRYAQVRGDIRKLFSVPSMDILPEWWRALEYGHNTYTQHGDEGELLLLDAMRVLPDTYTAIRGIRIARSLDADMLLLGPTGIWNLESKHWRGVIEYRLGKWTRDKSHYETGGKLVYDHNDISKAFDEQWQRENGELIKTLQRRLPKVGQSILEWLKGGIVFTHPAVILKIEPGCPVDCGNISYWTRKIIQAKDQIPLDISLQLKILDALLDFADTFDARKRASSIQLAHQIGQDGDAALRNYVEQAEAWLLKKQKSGGEPVMTSPPSSSSGIPKPASIATSQKPGAPKKTATWMAYLVPALALCCIGSLVAAVPASGLLSPSVCAQAKVNIYSQPISSAKIVGSAEKGACFHFDARTIGGWGRITGITLRRGSWIYLPAMSYQQSDYQQLPIVKP